MDILKEFEKNIQRALMPGIQGGPLMANIAAKAHTFGYAMQSEFVTYQKKVIQNAQLMSDIFLQHNIPVISNGTDSHLFVVDVSQYNKDGAYVQEKLEKECNIILNKNVIPLDTKSPLTPSGIRIGTPWITSLNYSEKKIKKIAQIIIDTIKS